MPDAESFLPLTPLSLAVLLALADADRHGYAILKEIERESEGRIRPGTGTLYAALQRMVDEGLIEEAVAAADDEEDARRRYYGITALGRQVARAEVGRLARLVDLAAGKRLGVRLGYAGPARRKGGP
jgi:DNA-binding PadR family transcriptional regulator